MKRREFLLTGVGGLLVTQLPALEKPKLQIIDTHTHFYDPTRPQGVPWPGKNDKLLYRKVLPEEFQKLTEPLGVRGTIIVEASPWVEDNQWLLDISAKNPFVLGIVGNLDPASEDFEKHLRRFAKEPLFRGIRISHQALTAGLKGKFVDQAKLMIDLNLELDVNGGPTMPQDVAMLAEKLPRLRIVINHCANLKIDGKAVPATWLEGMTAAAKHANVFCKVSALVEQTQPKPPPKELEHYKPLLDALWKLFGEDRLVFGSNWPVSDNAAKYDTLLGIVRDYFGEKGEKATAKFFQENSQVAYAWKARE